jgi:hypothetical protein
VPRHLLIGVSLVLASSGASCQLPASSAPPVNEFAVGVYSFIDVGPPFDFYEVYLVKATDQGSLIERVNVTPAGDACTQPPQVAFASRSSSKSISELLGGVDPCAIPEKKLHTEVKRCKNCLVFSGAHVKMDLECAGRPRLIKSDILDKDMFDPAPKTPEYTSWTMGLLGRLGDGFGPGVWDKPIFQTGDPEQSSAAKPDVPLADDFRSGRYDELFEGSSEKLSELYRSAEDSPPYVGPTVRLVSSLPAQPEAPNMPKYPPIARAAHVQGEVKVTLWLIRRGRLKTWCLLKAHLCCAGRRLRP